jgi:ABC-type multidrug transport system fused ATPase/permease subunit
MSPFNKKEKKGSSLKTVWFFIKEYKFHFFFLIAIAVLAGVLESLNVALLNPILTDTLGLDASSNVFMNAIYNFSKIIPINDALIRYSILFIILAVFVFLTKLVYFFFSTKLASRIVIKSKEAVFDKCINSDYQFFVDNKQGEILYKTSTAPNSISRLLIILSNVAVELILSVSIFTLLISLSWKATIILVIAGIGYYYLTKYLSLKVHYIAGRKKLESGQTETVVVNEYTTGIKQIKVFRTFPYWKNMFDKAINTYWKYFRKGYFWSRVPEILILLLTYIAIGAVIIFIKLQYPGDFITTIPTLGTFAFAIFMIIPKLSNFGNYRMQFMNLLPNIEAVKDMLKDKTYTKIKNGTKTFTGLKSKIELKNVKFSHKERDVLLDNVSLEIKKDKMTALVGASGSGKSTIVNLLLRLQDVDNGGVLIDNINIKELNIFSFLDKVGFVSQETFIFNASVKENISFGKEYSDEEVIEAAKFANAHDFIKKLPDGYDTIVGDRGMRLSGGEKQRIAIARAIIRKPEVLILDEATSSLDNVSENVVQKAINKVSKGCTTFIIAHRLSTIQNADIIYVIDEGKVVESGTHKELLSKDGKYKELYQIQKEK